MAQSTLSKSRRSKYDLVVVGGGAGGLAAAFRARFRGASVLIVQDGPIGGECTFSGCVPSKALLAAAARGESFESAMSVVGDVVAAIAAEEDAAALHTRGIDVIDGLAEVVDGSTVAVDGATIRAGAVVVAPGSRPLVPPIPGLADVDPLTNENLFQLTRLPARLAIIGGGPIGCEMAQAFAQLGSAVTLFEGADRLLPRDDADAAEVVRRSLVALGVAVETGAFVESVERGTTGIRLQRPGSDVEVDRVLVAVGRTPALRGMGPIDTTERGWISVDEHLETSVEGVYAVGDAIGSVQLTHAGVAMANVAVDNALKAGMARVRRAQWRPETIGWTTFTTPEVAQIGLTEAEAVGMKGVSVAEVHMAELDRAVAVGRTEGFVKLIAGPRRLLGGLGGGRLLGATVVGDRAGELLGELALAHSTGMFVGRLATTIHPYPTWSMALSAAATQFFTDAYSGRRARPPATPAVAAST